MLLEIILGFVIASVMFVAGFVTCACIEIGKSIDEGVDDTLADIDAELLRAQTLADVATTSMAAGAAEPRREETDVSQSVRVKYTQMGSTTTN